MSMTDFALPILLAYLLGSVPFAVVVSRTLGLADPRSYGSGNPGATNVLRTGNKKAAVLTLLGDLLKGAIAVLVARWVGLEASGVYGVALAVFVGHLFPVFLRFKGGKGVATAAGVLLALNPWLGLAVLGTWLGVAYLSRYSSLAAILAALSAPQWALLLEENGGTVLTVAVIGIALIARHATNIRRLIAGQESRIGSKKTPSEPTA